MGRVVAEVEMELIDSRGARAAPGEVGEICVRSRHVFPGYWRRPDLTEAAFVALEPEPARPFFRSGDLGRMDEAGKLHFAGRRDAQVKIRGHRIELAEVENALLSHPSVRQAAARTFDAHDGDRRLVGYYVGETPPPQDEALRSFLAERLPDSMIPNRFVRLEALPTTRTARPTARRCRLRRDFAPRSIQPM